MKSWCKLKPHLLVLVINTVFIAWLSAKTQTVDVAEQYDVLSEINGLKTLSLSLDRSIFELNVQWLQNYDPIVESQQNRDLIIDFLYETSLAMGPERARVQILLDDLSSISKRRTDITDDIKRAHSQLKIAESYFPQIIKEIIDHLKSFRNSLREQTALLRLGKLVENYTSSLSDKVRLDIDKQIESIKSLYQYRIARDPDLKRQLASVIEHARIIVDQAGRLQSLSQEILALDSQDVVAELYGVFSGEFAEDQYRSQSLVPMLYGILLLMIAHIVFLFIQLVAANRKAMEKADSLEINLKHEREVNGLQRQFVSMVSHEFRTPLAIIDGNAQRLKRSAGKGDAKRIEAIGGKIRLSVSRLVDLMESVLSAARLEEGRIQFEEAKMDLKTLVTEVVDNYRDLNSDRKITLNIDDLPTSYLGDPKLLRQVISNLLSNAIKYSNQGMPVDVEAMITDETIAIAVQDHGVGIPADEIDRISQRFFRASSATGIAGTGIGLHLVQYILNLHGGRLEVTSVLGKGSCFTAHLARKVPGNDRGDGADDAIPSSETDMPLAHAS